MGNWCSNKSLPPVTSQTALVDGITQGTALLLVRTTIGLPVDDTILVIKLGGRAFCCMDLAAKFVVVEAARLYNRQPRICFKGSEDTHETSA